MNKAERRDQMNDLIITLDDKVREYKELLDKKDELAELTKANTKALSRAKKSTGGIMMEGVRTLEWNDDLKENMQEASKITPEQLREQAELLPLKRL